MIEAEKPGSVAASKVTFPGGEYPEDGYYIEDAESASGHKFDFLDTRCTHGHGFQYNRSEMVLKFGDVGEGGFRGLEPGTSVGEVTVYAWENPHG